MSFLNFVFTPAHVGSEFCYGEVTLPSTEIYGKQLTRTESVKLKLSRRLGKNREIKKKQMMMMIIIIIIILLIIIIIIIITS